MINEYPRGLSFTPLAIPIVFTTHYSLDVCREQLFQSQVEPTIIRKLFGGAELKFSLSTIDTDLWEFDVYRKVGRIVVRAKGYLQKLDENTTSVNGYCDGKLWYYLFWILLLVLGILISLSFYNGTRDGLIVAGASILMFISSLLVNYFLMRRKAIELVRILEEILGNNQS